MYFGPVSVIAYTYRNRCTHTYIVLFCAATSADANKNGENDNKGLATSGTEQDLSEGSEGGIHVYMHACIT